MAMMMPREEGDDDHHHNLSPSRRLCCGSPNPRFPTLVAERRSDLIILPRRSRSSLLFLHRTSCPVSSSSFASMRFPLELCQ
ncbi:unnamed protein product [Sphagnum balticum]